METITLHFESEQAIGDSLVSCEVIKDKNILKSISDVLRLSSLRPNLSNIMKLSALHHIYTVL